MDASGWVQAFTVTLIWLVLSETKVQRSGLCPSQGKRTQVGHSPSIEKAGHATCDPADHQDPRSFFSGKHGDRAEPEPGLLASKSTLFLSLQATEANLGIREMLFHVKQLLTD